MAVANDDFPRGGVASVLGVGAQQVSITLVAVPGIQHIITDIVYGLYNSAAASEVTGVTIVSTSLGTLFIGVAGVDGTALDQVTINAAPSPLNVISAPGEAVTVQFTAPSVAQVGQLLTIKWYDI